MQTSQFNKYSGDSTMRLIFSFLLLFLILPLCSQAQNSKNTCGVYHKPFDRLTANQPVDLIDQFGNHYTYEELNVQKFRDRYTDISRNNSNCNGGDFTLDFMGFTCDEEITICNVFQELSGIIDIGLNGSSPLIAVIKEPFVNGNGTNNTEVLGIGTTYFQSDCGIANNLIFDVMYSDIVDDLPTETVSGVLRINQLLPFYNDVQGPVSGYYDLHTVAMHEVLHILGYSSQIADGGGTVQGFYSRWDTHLFSEDDDLNLITPGNAVPGCCDLAEFNPVLDYNQVITANCNMDIFFKGGGQNIARAYGVDYPATNPSGLLSHLDRCGDPGDQFVMSASLAQLEERDITQEEIDILEALGYEMHEQDVACSVIANNDYFIYNELTPNLTYEINVYEMLANDNLPDDFDLATDFTFHGPGSECGTIDEFVINHNSFIWEAPSPPLSLAFYRIRIPLCQSIDICYTIRGCDGECDDGIVTIQRVCDPCYPYLPECPPADICAGENLFCYGDFDDFIPKSTQSYEPVFDLDIEFCPSLTESPDILYNQDTGNRILSFFESESVILPLSTPILPGCTINLSYRAASYLGGTVNVFGSSESPCMINQAAVCPSTNQSAFQCISSLPALDGFALFVPVHGPIIPCDNTTPPDIDCDCTPDILTYNTSANWETVTPPPFVNNSTEPIEFLYITTHDSYHLYLDDFVVTAECDNEVELTVSNPIDACRGGEAEIAVSICIFGTNNTPQDVTVTTGFPNLPGLQITPGSDFEGGSALIAGTIAGTVGMPSCYTRTFNLQVGYNMPVGTQLEVNFGFETANACTSINSVTTSMVNVIDCEIPCILESYSTIVESCGNDGSIDVIVAGGSGSYTYQWSGGLGNGPSVSGLAPGTYEFMATDVTDPNCYVKEEYVVLPDENCGSGCVGEGTIEIAHEVVQIVCLESEEPGFDRYYIDMYIPNWGGTQNVNFELCSEDIFVTTPGVILESNESYLIQGFAALNIFTIIQVPSGTTIDQGICFETPVCIDEGQVCGSFCVTDFPICEAAICELEVVPAITLSAIDNTTCGNLSGDDLYMANVSLAIQNANGFNINYVQYVQINGNADPVFWQENNIPVIGGIANVPDNQLCWKAYDNQYFCFTVRIGYSDGFNEFECEVNICLPVSDLSSGMFDDGGGERRQNDLSFQKFKNAKPVFPVFPNPVSQDLSIQNPQEALVILQLMTLQGELLDQQLLNGHNQTKMKVSTYAPGIYLLQIRDASSNAVLQMRKVIVAH